MMENKAGRADKNLYLCICCCFLIALLAFGYYIGRDSGVFVLCDDFNTQQIPFHTALNGSLKELSGQWAWNKDLGTQLVGGYSYYNLGSIFFWITMPFDKNMFPYLAGWIYILKYVTAGITAYLYLKRFVKDGRNAVIGALLYAFSGFQTTNILFFTFHDVAAFFPLLLIGLEEMMLERKRLLFIFAVFINCLLNYFFFIGEVIFLALYFLFRFWDKPERMLKRIGECIVCGILGVGMAAVLFIPSVLFILNNPRTQGHFEMPSLRYYVGELLFIIKGFLLPGEAMNNQSMFLDHNWRSTACWLPMTGFSLALSYMCRKRDWLTKLLAALVVIAVVPLLSSMFYLFTSNYQRWWYMLTLMMAAATVMVLDSPGEFPVRGGILFNIFAVAAFGGGAAVIQQTPLKKISGPLILRPYLVCFWIVISIGGLLLLYFILQKRKEAVSWLVACTSIICCLTTAAAIFLYRQNAETAQEYMENYRLGAALETLDMQYRYDMEDNVRTMAGDAVSIWSFDSTVSGGIIEFNQALGFERDNFSFENHSIPGIKELLAARYRVTDAVSPDDKIVEMKEIDGHQYYVVEDLAAPIGFAQGSYVLAEEFQEADQILKGVILLDNLVIEAGQESSFASLLERKNVSDYTSADLERINDLVYQAGNRAVSNFSRDGSGFTCQTDYEEEAAIYFSVPYDDGWSAYIDGEKTEITDSAGMMAIRVPGGVHSIKFYYQTPGLMAGILCSAVSILLFGVLCVKEKRRN